jgi:epoxyqueuosine reductase QueG
MALTLAIKERALELGFDLAGIAPIGVWKDLEFSRRWVEKGFHGEMCYLENPKRFDPRLVLPSAKSVICVGLVYDAGVRSHKPEVRKQNKERSVAAPVAGGNGQRTNENRQGCRGDAARRPYCGGNAQRTNDNGPLHHSSFQLPFSSFHFPVSTAVPPRAWISCYAWGQDYHKIMRAKLEQLRAAVEGLAPGVETRVFVDTGPVVERAFARFSGVGWMGKNTCIINQEMGSWFFLGVILTSLELAPDLPAPDRCGSCMACLEACPTGALVEPYVMDASRCISYFTIELEGSIPEQFRPKIGANVFGCDICQEVCPWNGSRQSSVVSRHSSAVSSQPSALSSQQAPPQQGQSSDRRLVTQAATTKVPQFHPMIVQCPRPTLSDVGATEQRTTDNGPQTADNGQRTTDNGPLTTDTTGFSLFNPPLDALASFSEDDFRRIFAHSPIKRAKYRGWLRNLCVAMGNSGDERFVPWLKRAAQHSAPVVREHAAWALERLRSKSNTHSAGLRMSAAK